MFLLSGRAKPILPAPSVCDRLLLLYVKGVSTSFSPFSSEANEPFRLLAESTRDYAIFLSDCDGIITTWNPGVEQILGFAASEFVGRPGSFIFTPEDRERGAPEQERETAGREGRAVDERWHLKKDGSRFWASGMMIGLRDGAGNLRGFGKILRDFTAQKQTQDDLRAAQARTYEILESVTDAFYAVDKDFRFSYVNRKTEEWWSRPRETLVGRHYWTEFPGAVGSESYHMHLRAMAERQPVHYETVSTTVSTLVHKWIDVHIYPTADGGLSVYLRDITERKRSEDELRRALQRERKIAEVLQRPLTLPIAEDAFPGLRIATRYLAALNEAQVGGDFFDAFALARGRVALAVADASGKGLAAAARAIQAKEVLRAFTREYPHSPSHIAARLNDYLVDTRHFDEHAEEGFVTFTLVILDPVTGEASVVVAGAEPPLLLRHGGRIETVDATGLPLGLERGAFYHTAPLRLAPGDTLLLATDGITEARAPRTKARRAPVFLGVDGLIEITEGAAADASLSLPGMADQIVAGARAFGGGSFHDDVCLLLAQRL